MHNSICFCHSVCVRMRSNTKPLYMYSTGQKKVKVSYRNSTVLQEYHERTTTKPRANRLVRYCKCGSVRCGAVRYSSVRVH